MTSWTRSPAAKSARFAAVPAGAQTSPVIDLVLGQPRALR